MLIKVKQHNNISCRNRTRQSNKRNIQTERTHTENAYNNTQHRTESTQRTRKAMRRVWACCWFCSFLVPCLTTTFSFSSLLFSSRSLLVLFSLSFSLCSTSLCCFCFFVLCVSLLLCLCSWSWIFVSWCLVYLFEYWSYCCTYYSDHWTETISQTIVLNTDTTHSTQNKTKTA